jgi:hypothetical protein
VFSLLVLAQPSAPAVGVAYAFDVALSTIGWLVPLGVFRRPFGLVLVRKAWWEGEEKTCRAWRRTPPLNLSAAILARSGWRRLFEQTTQHTGMGAVTIWRPRRAYEIAQDSLNPMDRDSSWNQQRLQIFLAVSSFLPRFLPEFQMLITKFSRYRIVLPGDRPSFNGVHRDVELFSRALSRQPVS